MSDLVMCPAAVVRHPAETVLCLDLAGHEDWHWGQAEGITGWYRWPGPAVVSYVQPKVSAVRV